MKKNIAMFLTALSAALWVFTGPLAALDYEAGVAYDYFRSLPEGSWNGNSGALVSLNFGQPIFDELDFQLGGSYGLYNWDGRDNVVFKNNKNLLGQAFVTTGLTGSYCSFNGGLLYDRVFTNHYSIYHLSPSVDQLRFQGGYEFCDNEIGIWGTANLSSSHKRALGVPVRFRAVSQINLFWTHHFENSAYSSLWVGLPYKKGLHHGDKRTGEFTLGFEVRAPLFDSLYLDAHGSYIRGHSGALSTRDYGANICVGITYVFSERCRRAAATYMPIANNSNFLMDVNLSQ